MYLRISNRGVCDYRCFTILGVTSSRYDSEKIGQFGSGVKFGTVTLLRNDIKPIICVGNLKLEFLSKPQIIENRTFNQVYVRLSGQYNGRSIRREEDLSITLEHGIYDWDEIYMSLREYIANAIDKSSEYNELPTIDIVQNVRARKNYTQVYIPYTRQLDGFINTLEQRFLHFSASYNKNVEILQKENAIPCRIYHKGVLVKEVNKPSAFDYNLNGIKLDESRNSDEWTIRSGIGYALSKDKQALRKVLRKIANNEQIYEESIGPYTWDRYQKQLKEAFDEEFGEKAVLCSDATYINVAKRGYLPIKMPLNIGDTLKCVVKTDSQVLTIAELKGHEVYEATRKTIDVFESVWSTFSYLDVTNHKCKPKVMEMYRPTQHGVKIKGLYKDNCVYVDRELEGIDLLQTVIEEISHHCSGAPDASIDLQEYAFHTIAKMLT